MKLSLATAFLFLMALLLSVLAVSAQDAKCSLKLKIKDDKTETPIIGAAGVLVDKNSGATLNGIANNDELLFEGLVQSDQYAITLTRGDYKQTLVENYSPECATAKDGVIPVNAYMQKGKANDIYLARAKTKFPNQGVVNGSAKRLLRPAYPPTAKAAGAAGAVAIEVVIDEQGKVVSAVMLSGHPFLKSTAISAARGSTFKPTLMDGKPIMVSGIIIYNFN
jgi:TonB family protein